MVIRSRCRWMVATSLVLLGCNGSAIMDAEGSAQTPQPTHPTEVKPEVRLPDGTKCDAPSVGFAPLLRLSREQYVTTVRELLGVEVDSTALPEDERSGQFSANASAPLTESDLERYLALGEATAATGVSHVLQQHPCDRAANGDATCARKVLAAFAERAWRRPVVEVEVEVDALATVFSAAAAGTTYKRGIEVALRAVLASPYFLYRIESVPPSADTTPVLLAPYDLASRLSYFLWNGPPDELLR